MIGQLISLRKRDDMRFQSDPSSIEFISSESDRASSTIDTEVANGIVGIGILSKSGYRRPKLINDIPMINALEASEARGSWSTRALDLNNGRTNRKMSIEPPIKVDKVPIGRM